MLLLEYDPRFHDLAGDAFVQYDYNEPEKIPPELLGTCDYMLAGLSPLPWLHGYCCTALLRTACDLHVSSQTRGTEMSEHVWCVGPGWYLIACLGYAVVVAGPPYVSMTCVEGYLRDFDSLARWGGNPAFLAFPSFPRSP